MERRPLKAAESSCLAASMTKLLTRYNWPIVQGLSSTDVAGSISTAAKMGGPKRSRT